MSDNLIKIGAELLRESHSDEAECECDMEQCKSGEYILYSDIAPLIEAAKGINVKDKACWPIVAIPTAKYLLLMDALEKVNE